MPVISPEQFIQLADRLAANYELLVQAEKEFMAPPELALYQTGQSYPARLLLDLTNTGTQVLLQANGTGISGNSIYFSIVLPSTPNASLASQCLGTNLVLSLATDANGKSNTLAEDAIAFLQNTPDFTDFVFITYPVSGVGGLVQPYLMTALSGGVGASEGGLPLFTLMTTHSGSSGNFYTLTINQPTIPDQVFDLCWSGTDLVIDLPTDGAGAPTETLGQLQADLEAATDDFVLITNSPSAMTPAIPADPPTYFSGGSIGSYAQVVLTPPPGSTSADPDVAKGLMTPAQAADVNFTAFNLEQGLSYLSNLQSAMVNHFIAVGYSGGMAGFMTDFNILVHKNFSTLNNNRVGQTLVAANVFRPDQVVLGTVVQGSSALTLTPGTSLGSGEGNQTETNYGPQKLVAVLVPAGGSLGADWSFTLNLTDGAGTSLTSDSIAFTAGNGHGVSVPITAGTVKKFYAVNSASLVSGGSDGDKVFITQIIEARSLSSSQIFRGDEK